MSNSNITKSAYAASLQELMKESSFEKITVAQICEKCGMTRKSFYYHFKDKYELVEWIFDQEMIRIIKKMTSAEEFMEMLCEYLYTNRDFYRNLLEVEGQNSFTEHLEDVLIPLVQRWLHTILAEEEIHPLYTDFVADCFVNSIRRWLLERRELDAGEYVHLIRSLVHKIASSYSM